MKRYLLIPLLLLAGAFAGAQTVTVDRVTRHAGAGTGMVLSTHATAPECLAAVAASAPNGKAMCKIAVTRSTTPAPVVCPPAPAASTSSTSQACRAGTTGGPRVTTVTDTYTMGPPNACQVTSVRTSTTSGTCTPVVVPPPPPPTTGTALHFSDCQAGAAPGCVPGSNSNPGTQAAPKQNLAGVNVNTLPAGSCLLFNRGGAWINFTQRLENTNARAAAPLCFDAYGTGPAPVLKVASGNMFQLGGNWNNTSNDGGYTFRNLKFDGMGTAEWGFWFVQTVRDVVIENNEITGFRIGINSNDSDAHGVTGVTIRNNHIHRNRAMGLLGHYNNFVFEGNHVQANNFSGSGFDHGTYIGGGNNITVRNNHYDRNSVVNGVCQGGNMTFHGQIDGLLIEGNRIEQDAAAGGCWLMSITTGYTTPEWFRNAVVRNNKMINGGNNSLVAQAAPGIVIEGNVAINTRPTNQLSFNIGGGVGAGDTLDTNAIVRNNVACQSGGATGQVVAVNSPGATVTGNTVVTGAAATTGVCAR